MQIFASFFFTLMAWYLVQCQAIAEFDAEE